MSETQIKSLSYKAAKLLADLIRTSYGDKLPADDRDLLRECAHNLIADDAEAAELAASGDVVALAGLRTRFGLGVL